MTPQRQIEALAKWAGVADLWVLKRRGLYYHPNAHGYTANIVEAWKVNEATADKHVCPHDEPVTKHPAPLPDYLHDLNAVAQLIMRLDRKQQLAFDNFLLVVVDEAAGHFASSFLIINATAGQRVEALLRALGLWEDDPTKKGEV